MPPSMKRASSPDLIEGEMRAAHRSRVTLGWKDWYNSRTICYERAPSQTLKEMQAITSQGHSHQILAVKLCQDQRSGDVFKHARVPENVDERILAQVYPFVSQGAPGTASVPPSLFDLQDLMHRQLQRALPRILANEHESKRIHPVWLKLSKQVPTQSEAHTQLDHLRNESVKTQGAFNNVLSALLGRSCEREKVKLYNDWQAFKQGLSEGVLNSKTKKRLHQFQRRIGALATWGQAFPASRNGNFKARGLHIAEPTYHRVQKEEDATGAQLGMLTVSLQVPVIIVPTRAYETANPFVGTTITPTGSEKWACALVREIQKASVEEMPLQQEVAVWMQKISTVILD